MYTTTNSDIWQQSTAFNIITGNYVASKNAYFYDNLKTALRKCCIQCYNTQQCTNLMIVVQYLRQIMFYLSTSLFTCSKHWFSHKLIGFSTVQKDQLI